MQRIPGVFSDECRILICNGNDFLLLSKGHLCTVATSDGIEGTEPVFAIIRVEPVFVVFDSLDDLDYFSLHLLAATLQENTAEVHPEDAQGVDDDDDGVVDNVGEDEADQHEAKQVAHPGTHIVAKH